MTVAQTHRGETRISEREIGRAGQPAMSANDLLDDDHKRVLQLFNEYENVKADITPADRHLLARMICRELKMHARLEEEIYYPRVRAKSDAEDVIDKATAEHAQAKKLIRAIENASTQGASFDRKVKALEYEVRAHISAERGQLFDIAEIAGCNTAEMARELAARKRELEREIH
jgi:hemerythrin superfamily protein